MSAVSIDDAKAYLRVQHDSDDALLQRLLDAAEDQVCQYLGRDQLPNLGDVSGSSSVSDGELAPSVFAGVLVVVQAHYEGADAAAIDAARTTMQALLAQYRIGLGV